MRTTATCLRRCCCDWNSKNDRNNAFQEALTCTHTHPLEYVYINTCIHTYILHTCNIYIFTYIYIIHIICRSYVL